MPHKISNKFDQSMAWWVIVFGLILAACGGSATPSSIQPSSSATTSIDPFLPGTEWPASYPTPTFEEDLKFNHISTEQGLSQTTILCILQDSIGFLWFGSRDGLYRYDGVTIKIFKHDPQDPKSLSGYPVISLTEDHQGYLWIGTDGGGLNRYDRNTDTFRHYQHQSDDPISLADDLVGVLFVDRSGMLWVGTGRGLDLYDPDTGGFIHHQHDPEDRNSLVGGTIESITEDREGMLWIGTNGNGLNRFDPVKGFFSHFQHDPKEPTSLISNYLVSALQEDHDGYLWIGTLEGLDRLDPQRSRFTHFQHDPNDPGSLSNNTVLSIKQDQSGNLWVGTFGSGLNKFNPEKGNFKHYQNSPWDSFSLSNNVVTSIYGDRIGALWIGTAGGGLNRVDPVTKLFAHYQNDPDSNNSLSNNLVWSIQEDIDGVLWIGTSGGGLNRFDRNSNQWFHYLNDPADPGSLGNNNVSELYEDRNGRLWIGTLGSGLERFDPNTETFIHFPYDITDSQSLGNPFVYDILEDQDGMLWVATDEGYNGGLHQLNTETGRFSHYLHDPQDPNSLSDNWVRSLYEDYAGELWIGTLNGLNKFERSDERFIRYQYDPNNPDSLSDDSISVIYQDHQGDLWIGTSGGGLNKFNPQDETFTRYTMDDGLPSDVIGSILEAESWDDTEGRQLWISTTNGLSRFDPQTGDFKNYDASDGLQSNEFIAQSAFKSDSGEMFFGGANGFSAFYPDSIQDNLQIPPVVLTSLKQEGEVVQTGTALESLDQINFYWPNNSFEFEFAALNYIQPEKNQYAYMLAGFDRDWNYTGNRSYGIYTNLPGGSYNLRLKASNNDGIWNEAGVSISIKILPPFWETLWFRAAVSLVIGAIVFTGYHLRVRNLESRSRALEAEVEQRTKALELETEQRLKAEESLRQSEMERAVSAERDRLARELHDAVSQTLFSASLIAEALPDSWSKDPQEGFRLLVKLQQLSRGALAEMRALLLELRPSALAETSFADLLRQLADATTGREGIPVDIQIACECVLPEDVHITLYRIAQEALNNIVKHARASRVAIRWECTPPSPGETEPSQFRRATLIVKDDGQGFNPQEITSDHLGINIMHERAASIGASLAITSSPGLGTQVTVIWEANQKGEPHGSSS